MVLRQYYELHNYGRHSKNLKVVQLDKEFSRVIKSPIIVTLITFVKIRHVSCSDLKGKNQQSIKRKNVMIEL
jgi:hypothetical protein